MMQASSPVRFAHEVQQRRSSRVVARVVSDGGSSLSLHLSLVPFIHEICSLYIGSLPDHPYTVGVGRGVPSGQVGTCYGDSWELLQS